MGLFAEIGLAVRTRRCDIGLTQERVAQLSGLSRATISQIENGTIKDLSVARSARLLAVLGLSIHVSAARPKCTSIERKSKTSPLTVAARSASVSYRDDLQPTVLRDVLLRGAVPSAWAPHLNDLLEDASIELLARVVEALHVEHAVDRTQLWGNLRTLAHQLGSQRDIWARQSAQPAP